MTISSRDITQRFMCNFLTTVPDNADCEEDDDDFFNRQTDKCLDGKRNKVRTYLKNPLLTDNNNNNQGLKTVHLDSKTGSDSNEDDDCEDLMTFKKKNTKGSKYKNKHASHSVNKFLQQHSHHPSTAPSVKKIDTRADLDLLSSLVEQPLIKKEPSKRKIKLTKRTAVNEEFEDDNDHDEDYVDESINAQNLWHRQQINRMGLGGDRDEVTVTRDTAAYDRLNQALRVANLVFRNENEISITEEDDEANKSGINNEEKAVKIIKSSTSKTCRIAVESSPITSRLSPMSFTDQIPLKVEHTDGRKLTLSVSHNELMSNIYDQIAHGFNYPLASHILLVHKNKTLKPDDTPEQLNFSSLNGETIECYPKHQGNKQLKFIIQNNSSSAGVSHRSTSKREYFLREKEPFSLLFQKYSQDLKIDRQKIRFEFDGDLLNEQATPMDYDMDGNEIIDAFISLPAIIDDKKNITATIQKQIM